MNITIDWLAFVQVFVAAMISAVIVVSFYSLGLRLLVRAGRPPVVAPGGVHRRHHDRHREGARTRREGGAQGRPEEPADGRSEAGRSRGAYASFGVAALAVLGGLLLILFNH